MGRWNVAPRHPGWDEARELADVPDFSGLLPSSDIDPASSYNPSWWVGASGHAFTARRRMTVSDDNGLERRVVRQAVIRGSSPDLFDNSSPRDTPLESLVIPSAEGFRRTVPVRDMRLFDHVGEPWATFNTGHTQSLRRNDIYFGPLDDISSKPWRAIIPRRKRIEKNWGFFSFENALYALYSISPLVIAKVDRFDSARREARLHRVSESKGTHPMLSAAQSEWGIGSQPIWAGGSLVVSVHEKSYWLGKYRCYAVRLVEVAFDGARAEIQRVSPRMVHRVDDLSTRSVGNPLAFGVTYGSGLGVRNESLLLGYGFADQSFRIVEVGW